MNNYMDQSGKNSNSIKDDDRLADFTDQVLEGKLEKAESNADEELLGLEETILRLNRSLPSAPLDRATIKQMQVRLHARMRREAQEEKRPFWKRWMEPQFRPQLGMAFAVVMLLVVFVMLSPFLSGTSSPVTATALTLNNKNILIVGILIGIISIFIWIKRSK